jgi:hypothetical protein
MVELVGVSTDVWTAVANATEAAIVGVAAIFAYVQVREARTLREDQARPFVVLDFDMSEPPIIYLTIANIGNTMARRVKITTDPLLSSSLDQSGGAEPIAKLRVFTEEIPSLAPGKVIRLLFDSFVQRGELEDVYRVTITYEGDRRRVWRRERARFYEDESVLDLGVYRNIEYIHRRTIHDLFDPLKRIADSLGRWGTGVGSGILVTSRKEQRKERALARRRFRDRPQGSFAPAGAGEGPARSAMRRFREWGHDTLRDAAYKVGPKE